MNAAPFAGIVAGLRGERRALVTPTMATTHAGGPGVLMAAWMILEMELAAQDSTQTFLPEDHTTVGYEICVRHRRATPVGEWFRVASELVEVDGLKAPVPGRGAQRAGAHRRGDAAADDRAPRQPGDYTDR